MPILPPAPPLFSTMNDPPIACCNAAAIRRATMSEGPPGELATTILTARSGKAASAVRLCSIVGAAMPVANSAAPLMTRRRDGAMFKSSVLAIASRPHGALSRIADVIGQPSNSCRAGDISSAVDDAQVRLSRRLGGGVQVTGARRDGQQLQMRLFRRFAVEEQVSIY